MEDTYMDFKYILYNIYRAFYRKSNINQQMLKIIDMYNIYLRPILMFQQTSCHLQ
jgi:hypothetical protein